MKRTIKSLCLAAIVATTLTSCAQDTRTQEGQTATQQDDALTFATVSPASFQTMLSEKSGFLLDVRSPEEVAQGMIPEATNINYYDTDFAQQLESLDKTRPIFVYCRTGRRSAGASGQLNALGFKDVYNLAGGITAWRNAGFEVR